MSGNNVLRVCLFALLVIIMAACSKPVNDQGPYSLSYGDSILYLKAAAGDQIVYPLTRRDGEYSGFPDGIEVDSRTGAIDLSKSETGLRYRITHTAPDGKKTETKVVLSGITFTDKFYHLAAGDSIAMPVYNSSPFRQLPLTGSSFDEGNTCNNAGCAVSTNNGSINLAATVRNGVFGAIPGNDERREFEIRYRINDASGKTENRLKVLLYWYNTMADVPADLWETLNGRESDGVFLRGQTSSETTQVAKPRPPCVIIIAN